jgi:uncharacterized protein
MVPRCRSQEKRDAEMKKWISDVPNTLEECRGEIRLVGSECHRCKRVFFPVRKICPDCLDDKVPLERKFLSSVGKIYSFSIAQVAPPGYTVPHVQAYVDLVEGVRLFALLVDYGDQRNIRTGMAVELVTVTIRKDEDGRERLAYRFRPKAEGELL